MPQRHMNGEWLNNNEMISFLYLDVIQRHTKIKSFNNNYMSIFFLYLGMIQTKINSKSFNNN